MEKTCNDHVQVMKSLHEGTITMENLKAGQARIEEMLAGIMDRQDRYIAQSSRIEGIVQNGLSHNIKEMKEKMDKFCDEFGRRLLILENFSWFRDWITNLRNFTFFTIIKLSFFVALIYGFVYGGRELLESVSKVVLK